MGKLRSIKRKLKLDKVQMAEQVQYERVKLAKKMVEERVKVDSEFAQDVINAVGENLPSEIRKFAEESIAKSRENKSTEII
jgi:ribosomal protein L31E